MMWFDSDQLYKKMKYHERAIRKMNFSTKYPLFVSGSDDGSMNVFHGMVYEDALTSPLIVPVKILKGHRMVDSVGVMDCVFHP